MQTTTGESIQLEIMTWNPTFAYQQGCADWLRYFMSFFYTQHLWKQNNTRRQHGRWSRCQQTTQYQYSVWQLFVYTLSDISQCKVIWTLASGRHFSMSHDNHLLNQLKGNHLKEYAQVHIVQIFSKTNFKIEKKERWQTFHWDVSGMIFCNFGSWSWWAHPAKQF